MFKLSLDKSRPAVLVLDGNQRTALAVVRSLGRRGIPVMVGESTTRPLAGASRYCWKRTVYPSPDADPEGFATEVARIADANDIAVVLPVTDITTGILLRHRSKFARAVLPFPDLESFEQLTNKTALAQYAASLGVAVPATVSIDSREELVSKADRLDFPVVIKAAHSKILFQGEWIATGVRYARSRAELLQELDRIPWWGHTSVLIQQCIEGEGQGVFALYDRGRPLVWFAHRRLREKPPSGGVSVLSESIPLLPALRESTDRLLSSVGWHGVAMAEFKVTRDGRPYLIEVNGRFWGSLQLAVDAGVDFPYLLYRLATGQPVEPVADFEIGRKCRWLLGDLDRLYLVMKDKQPGALVTKLKAMAEFLRFRESGMRYEVNRIGDMNPFFTELGRYVRAFVK